MTTPLLIVGEIIVDFTLTPPGEENKLRLGGIAHAARGLWAIGASYSVAAICPSYIEDEARSYLTNFGCVDFIVLGEVLGAPNVMIIGDPLEVGDQGYEDLLRDHKRVRMLDVDGEVLNYHSALIFPGKFDLGQVHRILSKTKKLHLDIAYDVQSVSDLEGLAPSIETLLISTSSALFSAIGSTGPAALSQALGPIKPSVIVLKENRGGTRIIDGDGRVLVHVPAILGTTVNSVGVGDAFSAVFVYCLSEGVKVAGYKAARVASAYAQTTFPDTLKIYVERSFRLTSEQMEDLGGTLLAWEKRQGCQIYLAAPDFSYSERKAIDATIKSLEYHNFALRRPVQENGEVQQGSDLGTLHRTYENDVNLLKKCALVFAVPTGRDPGTLVEIGLAIQMGIPVVVYDPAGECRNTMVIAGANFYSDSLDQCLNATFNVLSASERRHD